MSGRTMQHADHREGRASGPQLGRGIAYPRRNDCNFSFDFSDISALRAPRRDGRVRRVPLLFFPAKFGHEGGEGEFERNTVAQTALNQACRAAADLPEVAHDTALAMNMDAAWNRHRKTRKHDPNTPRVVLVDTTSSRVDRKNRGLCKKMMQRHEPYARCDRLLRSGKADAPKYRMPPLKRGDVYDPETAVKIVLDLEDRFSQKGHVTATRLVTDKKVPGTERDVTRRVTQWRRDVEANLKLPETGGNREVAMKMAYWSVAAWGDVGARMLESISDFEIWMQTMTADGQAINREAVTKHLNEVKKERDASKNLASVRVPPFMRWCECA